MKGVIPAKLWKAILEIRALATFLPSDKGSYCIREITKSSSYRIYMQEKYKNRNLNPDSPV